MQLTDEQKMKIKPIIEKILSRMYEQEITLKDYK